MSLNRQAARLSRNATACQRCRKRKQKCDLRLPQCSNCEAAQVSCLSYHTGMHREIPRDYYQKLETEIERLKEEVASLRSPPDTTLASETNDSGQTPSSYGSTAPPTAQTSLDQQELIKSFALVVLEPSEEPRCLGTSSGVTLAKMVLGSLNCSPPEALNPRRDQASTAQKTCPLPPIESAEYLIDVYFQCRTPHFPILDRKDVIDLVNHAYSVAEKPKATLSKIEKKDLFRAFMVMAISLCSIHTTSGGRPEYEGFFYSALQYLDSNLSFQRTDVETLRIILLLSQFVSLAPSKGNLWLLTGLALRVSLDLGLHWETPEALKLEQTRLDARRRLFWATYYFERLLVVTLGRPFGVEEQSVNVGFPGASDPASDRHTQTATNHLVQLARFDSEIKHVLYRREHAPSLAYPQPDPPTWMEDIELRLNAWYSSISSLEKTCPDSVYSSQHWWDATYNYTLLLLHRPAPRNPVPSPRSLAVCFEASTCVITCVRTLLRENKLGMLWVWTHRLFVAGLLFTYAVRNSPELRRSKAPAQIINMAQSCASTMAVLAERFSGAAGCRNALETLVSSTVMALMDPHGDSFPSAGDTTYPVHQQDAPQASYAPSDFGGDLFQNMHSMLAEDMFGIYQGADPSTAWPDAADNFGFNMGQDQWSLTGWAGMEMDE